MPVDVTDIAQLEAMVAAVTQQLGPIDILCNNAGVIDTGSVVETTEAQWDAMMNVNVKGVFLGCKAVLPGMIERRRGRIINTASIAGKRGSARMSAYCASQVRRRRLHAIAGAGGGGARHYGQTRCAPAFSAPPCGWT